MSAEQMIHLWCGPRNISTALMYSFAQRSDMQVVDEPLYAHYFANSDVIHPGRDEVLDYYNNDGLAVLDELALNIPTDQFLFCKQMAHHFIALPESVLRKGKHALLIRDPKYVIHSFQKVIPDLQLNDIGIQQQFKLFKLLKKHHKEVVILDSAEVLKNPTKILSAFCQKLSIPFETTMLSWEKGAIKEDGIWAKYWYKNVHNSTGFKPYVPISLKLDRKYNPIYDKAQIYYHQLFEHVLKA